MVEGQGPIAFAIGAGGVFLDIFFLSSIFFFSFSLSLGECPIYCIVVVVLLFYVHGKHLRSYQ